MNILTLIGKPHYLPLELIDPYLEIGLELENQKSEKELSHQIESQDCPIIVAHYDIVVMESKVVENEDSFYDSQPFVD